MNGVYTALRETFEVPEDDRFMVIDEYEPENFSFGRSYLGIERSDDLVIIELVVSNTRTIEQKKALFRRIKERLADDPRLRPEDIFINLVEVMKENWSFGHGIAQYA
jgi:phenylpyruvate tautomerase PptA (4-oxalocrotonate tautomerase family)